MKALVEVITIKHRQKWFSLRIKGPKFSNRGAILLFQCRRHLKKHVFKWIRHFNSRVITPAIYPELLKPTLNLSTCSYRLICQINWSKHNNQILPFVDYKTRPCKLSTVATMLKALWIRHSKLKWPAPLRMDLALWLLLTILKL